MATKILVLGGSGMLGHKLVQVLSRNLEVYYSVHGEFAPLAKYDFFKNELAIEDIDANDFSSVRRAIEACAPDVVINAIGVIKQRTSSADVINTLTINSVFPHLLADLSASLGCRLITISTDCVFAGTRGLYSEDDVPDALDLYGQSKHWGEINSANSLTIRTSIIGRELRHSDSLLEWFISRRGGAADGYSRVVFSGFPTLVFADILMDIIEKHRGLSGVFHVSSSPISKFELLSKINAKLGLSITVNEFAGVVFDRSLDSTKFRNATGFNPPTWDEMIERLRNDPTPYDRWKNRTS
jgi:dTDP-4-dehydrorhamnose reductase